MLITSFQTSDGGKSEIWSKFGPPLTGSIIIDLTGKLKVWILDDPHECLYEEYVGSSKGSITIHRITFFKLISVVTMRIPWIVTR